METYILLLTADVPIKAENASQAQERALRVLNALEAIGWQAELHGLDRTLSDEEVREARAREKAREGQW